LEKQSLHVLGGVVVTSESRHVRVTCSAGQVTHIETANVTHQSTSETATQEPTEFPNKQHGTYM